jgi:hypothetical protein
MSSRMIFLVIYNSNYVTKWAKIIVRVHVCVCVTYKTGIWIEWLDLLHLIYSQLGTRGNYSTISVLHTLQFTVTHELRFSVFTSRVLATEFSQCQCNFKLHMKSSLHRLIPFLLLFCSCQFRVLDSIQFLWPQVRILAGWHIGTRHDTTRRDTTRRTLLDYSSLLLGVYSVPSSDCVTL